MAHPKRKHSHSRTCKKRTHQKLPTPLLVECKECRRLKPAHMVCPFCGYYAGREVVTIKLKEKKKKR
ncbi:MAG: 50S ribosomal protein L32 [Candidatus Omnitrophota bacterium]|nr:MAG: 50S ribosomal protein L32 [Candidatus Omnitrophota bacterium]